MPEGGISTWLEALGLGRYAKAFLAAEIEWETLPDLTDADLQSLGLPLGPRKVVVKAARLLQTDVKPKVQAATKRPRPAPRNGAERRNLTVLMCDMVGSTALATRLDPEELRSVMHRYMDCCSAVVDTFGGYVARYQGDGLMAYFGYPQAREDAAERAVRTALRLIEAVRNASGDPAIQLQTRVGVATGVAVVGDLIGEGAAREESVIGETPALAARLQALAPPDGIVIAQSTRELLGGAFTLHAMGLQTLKGFARAERAWQVTGEARPASRFAAARSRTGYMIGRDAELAKLMACWRAATSGSTVVVVLSGEPGLGKSLLVETFREMLAAEPHDLALLQCASYHQASAFRPLIEWIERTAGLTQGDPAELVRSKLRQQFGLSGEVLDSVVDLVSAPGEAPAGTGGKNARRERLVSAAVPLLTRARDGQPRLLVLEDAHWSDASTLDLLLRAAAPVQNGPLMVLVTSRAEGIPPWLAESRATAVALERLSPACAAQLVESMGGTQGLSAALRTQIVERAGGVPLFVEELTKSVLEADREHVEQVRRKVLLRVPATLQDTLMARLDRLGEDRVLAQIGSVLGREFSERLLAGCAGVARHRLLPRLARLIEAGVLMPRDEPGGPDYVFRHALVQEAAYLSLLRSERARLHGVIARMLESRFGHIAAEQPELVAHHYSEAGEVDQGVDWWQRASRQAIAGAASAEAVRQLEAALALLQTGVPSDERDQREIALRSALAGPLIVATGYGSHQTEANKDRLSALLQNAEPSLDGALVLYTEAAMLLMRSELDRVDAVARRCVHVAERCGIDRAPMMGQRVLGYAALVRGDMAATHEWFTLSFDTKATPHGYEQVNAITAHAPFASVLGQNVLLLQQQGRLAEAAACAKRAVVEAQRLGSAPTLGYVLVHVGLMHLIAGDVASGVAAIALLLDTFKHCTWLAWHGDVHQGWAEAKEGSLDAGLARMRKGLDRAALMQSRLWWPLYILCQAELLIEHGRYGDAADCLIRCDQVATELGQGYVLAELQRQRAVVRGAMGAAAAEVQQGLEAALDIARQQGTRLYELRASVSLARLWLRTGRREEAAILLTPITAAFGDCAESGCGDVREAQALLQQLVTVRSDPVSDRPAPGAVPG